MLQQAVLHELLLPASLIVEVSLSQVGEEIKNEEGYFALLHFVTSPCFLLI